MALLFLTRGVLFHEPTWTLWFKYAAGLVPLEPLRGSQCNASTLNEVSKHCKVEGPSWDVISQQHLFDVYIHPAPSFPGFEEGSIFYGREISNRVEVRHFLKPP